jgi:hypothetical protein
MLKIKFVVLFSKPTKYLSMINNDSNHNTTISSHAFEELKLLITGIAQDNIAIHAKIDKNNKELDAKIQKMNETIIANNDKLNREISLIKSNSTYLNDEVMSLIDSETESTTINDKKRKKSSSGPVTKKQAVVSTGSNTSNRYMVSSAVNQPITNWKYNHTQPTQPAVFDNQARRKKTQIIGTNTLQNLNAAPEADKPFNVYIGRIDINESNDKVIKILKDLQLNVTEFSELPRVHSKFKSFTFKIPSKQKYIIYNPTNWPIGIVVNKYTPSKNIQITSNTNNNQASELVI